MSMPSAFELGGAIGANVAGGIRGAQENSALDQILQQAIQSNDPQVQNDVMRQILTRVSPEKREGALQVLQNRTQQMQQQRRSQALTKAGYDPDLPESILKEQAKQRVAQSEQRGSEDKKLLEAQRAAKGSLDILKRQRELLDSGHIGSKVGILGTGREWGSTKSPEGIKARGEYERLGKSLIQASTNIPIRNKQEFETLAKGLYNTDLSREQIAGNIDAMERIINNSIGDIKQPQVQPTLEQVQDSIFKGQKASDFVRPDGSKINVSKDNNQQIISALSQGYAPEGYVSMLAPDGFPDAVPIDEVQNELNNGSIIIYGY